jgi:hypothetical protein
VSELNLASPGGGLFRPRKSVWHESRVDFGRGSTLGGAGFAGGSPLETNTRRLTDEDVSMEEKDDELDHGEQPESWFMS